VRIIHNNGTLRPILLILAANKATSACHFEIYVERSRLISSINPVERSSRIVADAPCFASAIAAAPPRAVQSASANDAL
jgi:hypothetical protein